jgi:GxxExxY protein
MSVTKDYLKELIYQVNGAAIHVHKHTGPGLIESVYHKCMVYELSKRNIFFQSELQIPINYDGLLLDVNLRCDLFVENTLVVEFKSVDKILPIHTAQMLTYMKLLKAPMGLIINFNCTNIYKEGQQTYVNAFYENLP